MKVTTVYNTEHDINEVQSYGELTVNGERFHLLHPHPVEADSWQRDHERRFYVTPYMPFHAGTMKNGASLTVYMYPRHIVVSGDYLIEYKSKRIYVEVFDE